MTALGQTGIVQAMEEGGAVDGPTAGGYLYHSARICRVIAGSKICVDFGCGTGAQLLQVAQLNPSIKFIGVDCESKFLTLGKANAEKLGVKNVQWLMDDITSPTCLADHQIDAVISTMALHNLRNYHEVAACLVTMQKLVGASGALYIEDFSRLKSSISVDSFVAINGLLPQDKHSALFRASISAAFTLEELRTAAAVLANARFHSTFLVPLLVIIKTPDRAIEPATRENLLALRAALPNEHRRSLDGLHKFLSLGGLRDNPFR